MRARRVWHGGGDAQKIGHTARHGRAMQKDALYVRCAMKSRIVCMNDHYYALAGNRTRVCCELRSVHYEQTFGVLVLALHACDRGADATVIVGRQLFYH
jgi:predicted transcriptional regulator